MVLVGAGQGASLSPLTASGIAGVDAKDSGAASGLVNIAHQLGSSLGLGVVAALSFVGAQGLTGAGLMVHRTQSALLASAIMLALVLRLILRGSTPAFAR